jgi:CBS domain-containing protein
LFIEDKGYEEYKQSQSKNKLVKDIMSKNVATVPEEATMLEAAKIMGEKHIGSLIVERKDASWGIITERDLISRTLGVDGKIAPVRVKECMSTPLITISPDISIKEAAKTMMTKKGRLVVCKNDKIVGVVTTSDLIKVLPECPETAVNCSDYMTEKVVSLDEDSTILEAAEIMGKKRIGSVIVDREGEPFGIFTERDLLTNFLAEGTTLQSKLGECASEPLITIPAGTSIHRAAYAMASKHVRRLPVIEEKKMIGIITARDLVEAYTK